MTANHPAPNMAAALAASTIPIPDPLQDYTKVEKVQLEALVALKIIKHCRETLPNLANGQLLGLNAQGTLQVTNCFPLPSTTKESGASISAAEAEADEEYQLEMMKCLRELNVDNNDVGWYQSTYFGSFFNNAMIESQFNYQTNIPYSIVIIYDPMRTNQGTMSLRAFRLSKSFMDIYSGKKFTAEVLKAAHVNRNTIFEELQVVIHNSLLVNAFMYELQGRDRPSSEKAVEKTPHSKSESFLEKSLELLIQSVDEIAQEQQKFQYYQYALSKHTKRKSEALAAGEDEESLNLKAPHEPSRLESLLVTNQIDNYCKQIGQFAGQSFSKLFLTNGLQKA